MRDEVFGNNPGEAPGEPGMGQDERTAGNPYRLFVERANEGFWSIDRAYRTTYVNPKITAMLGFSAEEMLGRPMTDFVFPEDREDQIAHLALRPQGQSEVYERRLRKRDGSPVWTQVSATPVFAEDGSFSGSFAIYTDISRQKREESIQDARYQLIQYALEHPLDELLVHTLDLICDLTGSLIGFYHFLEADQKTLSLQVWSTETSRTFCRAEGKGSHYDVEQAGVWVDCVRERRPIIHNDYLSLPHRKGMPEGHALVTRELVVPVFRGQMITAILGIGNKPQDYVEEDLRLVSLFADQAWDIAERKIAEENLRESDERFRRFTENAQDIIFHFSLVPHMHLTYINPAVQAITGYTPAECYADPNLMINLAHPDDAPIMMALVNQEKIPEAPLTMRWIGKDGVTRWMESRMVGVRGPQGQLVAVEGITRDISERIQVEDALRQSERAMNIAQAIAQVGSYSWNAVDMSSTWSEEIYHILGINPAEPLSLETMVAAIHPDDRAAVIQASNDRIATRQPLELEFRIIRPDGEIRHVYNRDQVNFTPAGRPTFVFGTLQDITERKQIEAALRASEENYRQLFEAESDAIFLIDNQTGRILQANSAALAMYGYERQEVLQLRNSDLSAEPEETQRVTSQTPLAQDTVVNIPRRVHRRKDGSTFLVEITGRFFSLHGRPVHIAAIRDITARVKAEEALQEYASEYDVLIKTSLDGFLSCGRSGKILAANDSLCQMLGYSLSELMERSLAGIEANEKPADIAAHVERAIHQGSDQFETRYYCKDGRLVDVEVSTTYVPHQDKFLAFVRDISARKRAERELRESLERFQRLVDASPTGILVMQNGCYSYANPAGLASLGYSRLDEIVGLAVIETVHPDSRERFLQHRQMMDQQGIANPPLEMKILSKDKQVLITEATSTPITFNGEPAVLILSHDITIRKGAEQALRESEDRLRASLEEKEVLLRELYHRTKNNMQVISAMLSLQRHDSDDPVVKEILTEMENRILSMALVHQKLYQSRNLSRMDLGEYLGELAALLQSSYQRGQFVDLDLDLENFAVLIDIAIPCGLIANELISNAYKHAFQPGTGGGEIRVSLRRTQEGQIRLAVRDNGAGLPDGFNPRTDGRLGIRTLVALVEHQLQGTITFDSSPHGLAVQIEFIDSQYLERV